MLYMPAASKSSASTGRSSVTRRSARSQDWRRQGAPKYIQAVTEEPEDGGHLFDGEPTGEEYPDTKLYQKVIQIVAESRKASTSTFSASFGSAITAPQGSSSGWRRMASSASRHVGRREALIDPNGPHLRLNGTDQRFRRIQWPNLFRAPNPRSFGMTLTSNLRACYLHRRWPRPLQHARPAIRGPYAA